jgi:hypothetical protein
MMCEDGIGMTSAGESKARVAQRLLRGSSQKGHPAFHIIAVSGEITLHAATVYVQVCQPATGADSGILIRTCKGRDDYTGGPNNFAPLNLLDDIGALADACLAVLARNGARP